jgi:tetratricopeptide (TPR) repeat protein
MLHVLLEYARERLAAAGEARDVSLAHAIWCRDFVERLEPGFRTSRHREVIERLELDEANFVRAIEWALETGESELALDLFGKLRHLWWDRGHHGWVLAQRVLSAAPTGRTLGRAGAFHAAAGLAFAYGDLDQAVSLDEEALDIYRELDDSLRAATVLMSLGSLYQSVERADAKETLEQGLAGLQAAGDDYGVAVATVNLADFAAQEGDFATAARLSEEAAARAREHGFEFVEATATCNHATALVHVADPRAGETARSALRLCLRTKMDVFIANSLFALAAAMAATEPERAALLLGAGETELQGARLYPAEKAVYEIAATAGRDALGPAPFEQLREEGRALTREAAVELGLSRFGTSA